MRQAPARKISDTYLDAPRRSERHLHAVANDAIVEAPPEFEIRGSDAAVAGTPERRRVVSDLREAAPSVEIPDWAEPFADPRWDDRIGEPHYEQRDGRRTVLVTGRPEGKAVPRREATIAAGARKRRQSPTRARIAGRPDRVALWAVALGLLMAAMAGFSGNGASRSPQADDTPAAPQLLSR